MVWQMESGLRIKGSREDDFNDSKVDNVSIVEAAADMVEMRKVVSSNLS